MHNVVSGQVYGTVVQAGTIHQVVLPDPVPVPRQLPPDPAHFVGRAAELALLDDAAPATVLITAAGGSGKTWLAVRWAQGAAERFPDGQLFVDLRGFSTDTAPMDPAVAVRGFLDVLGVAPGRIPAAPHAQAALYRSLVAQRRILVVLDNAASTEQVVPLLPGGRAATVVVTSRRTLTALVSRHGATQLHLDHLTAEEAHALLTSRLGPARVAAEPDAVAELIGFCGGFALALGLVAARGRPADTARELRELGLDGLDDEDPTASLPTVLSWSYRALGAEQRTMFLLLGIAPGPDLDQYAAASISGWPPPVAGRVLRELTAASLAQRDTHGRYRLHDLVRAYALAQGPAAPERTAALRRAVDFYLHTARATDHLLEPGGHSLDLGRPAPGVHLRPLADADTALAWFDTEHQNLLAAQRIAVEQGWHADVWRLAWGLYTFHHRRGHRHDDLAVWQAALASAPHLPDPTVLARTHRYLGRAHTALDRHEEAVRHLEHALDLAGDDRTAQGNTHQMLAWSWGRQGEDQRALDHARRALAAFRGLDQPVWEAEALNDVGWFAARTGDLDAALTHCQAALDLHRGHRNADGEAATLDSLGHVHHRAGRPRQAVDHYRQALTRYQEAGNDYQRADTLEALGDTHAEAGDPDQAAAAWREAAELYESQAREADLTRVRTRLGDR